MVDLFLERDKYYAYFLIVFLLLSSVFRTYNLKPILCKFEFSRVFKIFGIPKKFQRCFLALFCQILRVMKIVSDREIPSFLIIVGHKFRMFLNN